VHFDYFSAFTFLAWERFGVVSSAETFIALAGIVVGLVFGGKAKLEGIRPCIRPLFSRALDLYKANLIVVISIGLRRYLPWFDVSVVTHFNDPYSGKVYDLYPPLDAGLLKMLGDALLLRCGPHQFQIMGLYACLFLLTPFILYLLVNRKAWWLSALSVGLYLLNFFTPEAVPGTAQIRLTGAAFEFAFPLLAWQVLFVHAVMVGYYKIEIVLFFSEARNQLWIWLCVALSAGFMFFSLNHPLDKLPPWAQLSVIDPVTFQHLYDAYFHKYSLAPGRLLNEVVLFVAGYAALTRLWKPIEAALGWLFIPLGAASAYVFTVHVFLLAVVDNTPLPHLNSFAVNTALHGGLLLLVWFMVKKQFLFRWLPH
jgi:hypothetical protein